MVLIGEERHFGNERPSINRDTYTNTVSGQLGNREESSKHTKMKDVELATPMSS